MLDFSACGVNCKRKEDIISCDMCPDENGVSDGNCDGILQSGESGFIINLTGDWRSLNKKIDNNYGKLIGCVMK